MLNGKTTGYGEDKTARISYIEGLADAGFSEEETGGIEDYQYEWFANVQNSIIVALIKESYFVNKIPYMQFWWQLCTANKLIFRMNFVLEGWRCDCNKILIVTLCIIVSLKFNIISVKKHKKEGYCNSFETKFVQNVKKVCVFECILCEK